MSSVNLLFPLFQQMYNNMPTSVGHLEPPLGRTRLQVAKLITALVGANMHQVNQELASLETVQTLLVYIASLENILVND